MLLLACGWFATQVHADAGFFGSLKPQQQLDLSSFGIGNNPYEGNKVNVCVAALPSPLVQLQGDGSGGGVAATLVALAAPSILDVTAAPPEAAEGAGQVGARVTAAERFDGTERLAPALRLPVPSSTASRRGH